MGADVCEDGSCVAPCEDDDACEGVLVCDVNSGRCVLPDSCADDQGCPEGLVCESNACIEPDCVTNDDCDNGVCVGRLCLRARLAPAMTPIRAQTRSPALMQEPACSTVIASQTMSVGTGSALRCRWRLCPMSG